MVAPPEAPLRIVLTVHHDLSEPGGAAGSTLSLADELSGRGHHVDVVGLGLLRRRRGGTLDAIAFPHAASRHVAARLRRADVDVVDASSGDLAYLSSRQVRAATAAVFTRSHGLEHLAVARRRQGARDGELVLRRRFAAYHGGLRLFEVARSFRSADGALLLNDAELAYATGPLRVPAARAWTTSPIAAPPPVPAAPPAARDVLVLGPMTWRKGGDVAVAALDALARADSELTASWHGLDDVDATRHALGRDVAHRVELGGPFDREQLGCLLASHRVLLFASRFEGMPLTLLEAGGAGLATVGTDVPGVRDLLGGGAGLLVPDGHVEGLVGGVRRLLRDDALRTACASAARDRAATRATASVVDDLVTSYRTVVAVKQPPH